MKHFCVYFIHNCRGGCPHPPELRGDVGIAPYKKMSFIHDMRLTQQPHLFEKKSKNIFNYFNKF